MASKQKSSSSLVRELSRYNPDLPLEQASTIPGSWYLSVEVFEAERQSIFHQSWQYVARTDQLKEPGSFVTATLAGEPLILARDRQGELRCFANVCRHKAARIACQPEGNTSVFQCRYHGWSYDLEGRLRGAPEFSGVCDFDKDSISLPSYSAGSWGPFVFVNLGDRQDLTLEEFLKPLTSMHEAQALEKLAFVERRVYELRCNWKVFIDNYLDGGYHVTTLHPALSGVVNYAQYNTRTFDRSSVQISPLKDGEVSSVRSGEAAYYWWLFPNFMINIYEGYMDTNLVLPLGVDRCQVIFDFYFDRHQTAEGKCHIEESIRVAEQVQDEDIAICEDVQQGLNSTTYDTGRLSRIREEGIYHFHKLVADRLGSLV